MESARIPGQQGAQATHDTRAARAGGKPAAQRDAAGAGAPQDGFSALLAALGGDPAPLQDAALLGTDDGGEPADPASLAAAPAGDTAAWPVFWNAVPGSALPSVGGTVAASPGPQGTLPAGVVGDAAATVPAWSAGTGTLLSSGGAAPDSLVAQTALLDGAADAAQRQGAGAGFMPTAAAGAKGAKAAWQGWSAAAQGDAAGMAAGVPKGAIAEKKMLSDALASAPALAMPGTQAGADRREAGGAQMAGSVRQGAADLASLVSAGGQVLPESLNEWRAGARGGESSGASAPHAHGAGAAGEAVADPTLAASDGMGVSADPTPVAGDDALSEQVAFWVHQKTQNAELTLDRDGQPVEVKVSLSGNEAHVTFRSDQVQTRDALDASVAQLRDLLQREGMVLSGVTVGASGAGDGGAGRESSPGRQGAQHARVQAAATEAVAGTGRAGGAGNRAVDIFV